VPEAPYRIPLGIADVRRAGTDVTLVGIAATVGIALEAADLLAAEGISAEVIDPRTLSPLDADSLVASVEKTGAMVVIDESPPRCSIATDIAAIVGERAFDALDAPIRRVTSPHTPVPFSPPLERAYMPTVAAVVAAVRSTI
jgi:pyruvate dehydrogenase E1 component beta subunit